MEGGGPSWKKRLLKRLFMGLLDMLQKDAAIERLIRYIQSIEIAPIWESWYVGITDDPTRRLYLEHKAPATKSVIVSVDSGSTARSVEKYLIDRYGMEGNPGGDENPHYVYVFKKSADTDPPLDNRAREKARS
jgi:hypothetical protein